MGIRLLAKALALVQLALPAFAAEPLVDAVQQKKPAELTRLLKQGADANSRQVDGMTALHWAAYLDDLESARVLLDAGAEAKATNRYGVTPLSLACLNGNGELVQALLKAGADPNATLRGGETALMTAARVGKPAAVKALIEAGAEVNSRERRGQTAIMWAASEGHTETVELLAGAGADFKATLDSGFNPLFFAVRDGRTASALALIKAGADVNGSMQPKRTGGKSPRAGTSPLVLAVENGHFELALALVDAGADPNDQRSGFTALHTLSWVRKPNRGDGDDGDPAPAGSGNVSSLEFARRIVARGADVNARLKSGKAGAGQLNRRGATPFLLAAQTADLPLMRLLVGLGADPLLPNADGATPLMAAAGLGTLAPGEEAGTEDEALAAVKFLLQLGARVNDVDQNGETAMHGAAYKSLPRMVDLLSANGAQVKTWNKTNRHGWTPLRIAEGYRPGNFKPSAETIAALHKVMLASGATPPTNAPAGVRSGY